jgi:hypothetical protein
MPPGRRARRRPMTTMAPGNLKKPTTSDSRGSTSMRRRGRTTTTSGTLILKSDATSNPTPSAYAQD